MGSKLNPAAPPGPVGHEDLDGLVGVLRRLKTWAGDPSFTLITRRVNDAWRRSGRPESELAGRSTVAGYFTYGRARLNGDLLLAIVAVLCPDPGYVASWREALRDTSAVPRLVRFGPPPEPLVGRAELLEAVHRRFAERAGDAPVLTVLHGAGGIGKTSLARAYARGLPTRYGLVWQLPAEDPVVLAAGFAELARHAGLGPEGAGPVGRVHAWLAASKRPWLLILDNAPDPAAIAGVLPSAGPGHVLVTSRHAEWPGHGIEVPPLLRDDAVALLTARTGADPGDPDVTAIAGHLDGLPLALEQCAGFMTGTGATPGEYLRRLLDAGQRGRLLRRGGPADHGGTVASTWAMSVGALPPAAVSVLRLAAFLAPEPIPVRALMAGPLPGALRRLADPFALDDAIAALRRHSLIARPADGTIAVHRLVQLLTRDALTPAEREEWRRAAVDLLTAALPGAPTAPETWPAYARLLPHAVALFASGSPELAETVAYLGESGDFGAAAGLQERVVRDLTAVHGPDDPVTLAARMELGGWLGETGDIAGALAETAHVMTARLAALGPRHRDTLLARRRHAHWTACGGDLRGALAMYDEVVPDMAGALGPEHPDTLCARHAAAATRGVFDPWAARAEFAAVLAARTRVLGPEHVHTLYTRHEHAHQVGMTGDAAAARDEYARILPSWARRSGPDHPDVLLIEHRLALWTGRAGAPAAARDAFAALLPRRAAVLGDGHPDTVATRLQLDRWTEEARRAPLVYGPGDDEWARERAVPHAP